MDDGDPDRIDKYIIEDRIGDGSAGVVYRAIHEYTRRTVALKVLEPGVTDSEMGVERFRREVSVSTRVDDHGIVEILDAGTYRNTFYVVMELLEGEELGPLMGAMRLDRGLRLLADAARTLASCHDEGIIHRDLKPANIFIPEGEERTKILDFGIASIQDGARATETAATMGTPYYVSPEQARDARTAGAESDIWSIGVITYELLTGDVPFTGSSTTNIFMSVIHDPPRPLSEPDRVPEDLLVAIAHSLEKDPGDRYGDARALAATLESAADEVPSDLHVAAEPPPEPRSEEPEEAAESPDLRDPRIAERDRRSLDGNDERAASTIHGIQSDEERTAARDERRSRAQRELVGGIVPTLVDNIESPVLWGALTVLAVAVSAVIVYAIVAPKSVGLDSMVVPAPDVDAGPPADVGARAPDAGDGAAPSLDARGGSRE